MNSSNGNLPSDISLPIYKELMQECTGVLFDFQ